MRKLLLATCICLVSLISCKGKSYSDEEVQKLTGWFYVIESNEGIKLFDKQGLKKFYIDPEPIVTEGNFKEVELINDPHLSENEVILKIKLDEITIK